MNYENLKAISNQNLKITINNLPCDGETCKLRTGNIQSFSSRFLLNERRVRSRILYAGPHPINNQAIATFKICEMFGGKYYLEENIINPFTKSLQSRLVSLDYEQFHKYVDPKVEDHYRRYFPRADHTIANCYIRELDGRPKVFQNIFIEDDFTPTNFSKVRSFFRELRLKLFYLFK